MIIVALKYTLWLLLLTPSGVLCNLSFARNDNEIEEFSFGASESPNFAAQIYVLDRSHIEVNGVQLHRLPFPNVRARAHVIWSSIHCENQAVIFVLKTRQHVLKQDMSILDSKHLLHEKLNFRQIWTALIETLTKSRFGESISDIGVRVSQPFRETKRHFVCAIDH